MNINTRTPKSTYMNVQVRTINLNRTKRQKTQNQSVNIQDNQEHYEQHGNQKKIEEDLTTIALNTK